MFIACSTTLFPELSDPAEIARRIAKAGFDGIEWRIHADYHIAPDALLGLAPRLHEIAQEHDLRVPCLASYAGWDDHRALESLVRAASILGCPRVRLFGFVYDGSQPYAQVHADALRTIERAIPIFAQSGVSAVIETHFGTIHASAQGAWQLVRHVDPAHVGVILDGANLAVEGREDWRLSIDVLGPYLQHVHVRNTEWYRDPAADNAWCWRWTDLARGLVPWPQVFAQLRQAGYRGSATSENIWGVPKRTTGYIGEIGPFMGGRGEPRTIEERLGDIHYLRAISH